MFQSIGFIGTGHMGSALARAAAKGAAGAPLYLSNRSPEKAKKLAIELDAKLSDNRTVAQQCQIIFLAVKPQMMAGVLEDLAPTLAARKERFVLASMAAGLTAETIQKMAGGKYPVIRLMPNTPSAVGAGVVQYCGLDVTEEELKDFKTLLAPAGLVDRVEERLIDAASAVSGCGPAFLYLFLEALADGGVACGLPRDKALAYAAQMAQGAAKMVLESGQHPGALKDAVCSPGGSTIQGVRALEEQGFRAAAMNAVIAAYEKTLELGKG